MDSRHDVIERIEEKYPSMSKSHKTIAEFIREHYDQAVFMTAAKIGEELSVSESTVVRFASGLGYEGYPQFQKELENWVKSKLSVTARMDVKYGRRPQSEVLTSVLEADIEKIKDTIQNLEPDAFDMAIKAILSAKNIYIVGLRSCAPLAEFLHFYLNMIRGNVIRVNTSSVSELFEQMLRIDEKDVIIGISFPRYSMRTLKAMEFANDRNATVISLTDSIHSPMCLYSSINLLAKSEMVSIVDSLVAPLSVINALVVGLCLKRPQTVKKNLEALEEVWENYQVYLNDEINFIDEEPMLDNSLWKGNHE